MMKIQKLSLWNLTTQQKILFVPTSKIYPSCGEKELAKYTSTEILLPLKPIDFQLVQNKKNLTRTMFFKKIGIQIGHSTLCKWFTNRDIIQEQVHAMKINTNKL